MQWRSDVGGDLGNNAEVLTEASLADSLDHSVSDLPCLTIYVAVGPVD